jgi:hypothetical protein
MGTPSADSEILILADIKKIRGNSAKIVLQENLLSLKVFLSGK